ncbi:MAG: hypothetical protein JRI88_03185 [Deltaproteobacteria bacterium]|nr:hypothetical protein [Deltaproteobacteria bacterium]MBW1941056.1 hypothetical protein [Deltaproteobacteria bacterium]
MHIVLKDLDLQRLWVIYPGKNSYPAHEKVSVLPLSEINTLPGIRPIRRENLSRGFVMT